MRFQAEPSAIREIAAFLQQKARECHICVQEKKVNIHLQKHPDAEAKDNVKFLTTLERCFKALQTVNRDTITQISDIIPSLLGAVRMVWIISRYFNIDEYMEPLMKRVADQISDKVEEAVQLPQVGSFQRFAPLNLWKPLKNFQSKDIKNMNTITRML